MGHDSKQRPKPKFVKRLDKLDFYGKNDGKAIIRNDVGRTVAVVSYRFNSTSGLLGRMVFGRRSPAKKGSSTSPKNMSYRKYGHFFHLSKAHY